MKSTTNWGEVLSNASNLDAYMKFVGGQMSRRQMEQFFKNTPDAGTFRSLVRNGGSARARAVAKKALKRRALI